MDAHIENETQHWSRRGVRAAGTLVHLILPPACLAEAGIPLSSLLAQSHPASTPAQVTRAQTRFHGSGLCTPWTRIHSRYVATGALASVLVPSAPRLHPRVFDRVVGRGGLFVSLPLRTFDGHYDHFTRAALRVETGAGDDVTDLEFTYEELLPPGTRYSADRARLTRLYHQLVAYVRSHTVPPAAATAGSHLEALLAKDSGASDTDSSASQAAPAVRESLDYDNFPTSGLPGFDDPVLEMRLEDRDQEIMALLRRAAEIVARRHPVRAHPCLSWGTRDAAGSAPRVVASGLIQGATATAALAGPRPTLHVDTIAPAATHGPAPSSSPSLSSAAGPPDGGPLHKKARHTEPGTTDGNDDVLMFSVADPAPRTPGDWLDVAYAVLADGDTLADLWRRRPVSVIERTHAGTGKPFLVLSYQRSTAWGGGCAPPGHLKGSVGPLLAERCLAAGVTNPRYLGPGDRAELVRKHPFLGVPLGDPEPPLAAFDAAAEVVLRERFRGACAMALLQALDATLRDGLRLHQRLRYEIPLRQRQWVDSLADRVPAFFAAFFRLAERLPSRAFLNSALCTAALAHLARRGSNGGRAYVPRHRSCRALLKSADVQVFDYYSSGGEVVKVSHAPVVVRTTIAPFGQRTACVLARRPSGPDTAAVRSGPPEVVCTRYAPGENYAYVCFGFSRDLECQVIFPGGFAVATHVAPYLIWPPALEDAILSRLWGSVSQKEEECDL